MQIEIKTSAGLVRWAPSGLLQGAEGALAQLRAPRPGSFGMMPDQVPFDKALSRKDTFLHLVATVWPDHQILTDTVPDEKWSPNVVY